MAKRNTLQKQVDHALMSKAHIGESRHAAKQELRDNYLQKGEKMPFGTPVEGIHSIQTFKDYQKIGERFVNWCISQQNVGKYTHLSKVKELAPQFLREGEQQGKSLYTLKTERAALGKIFGETIPYKFEKQRTTKEITRSRGQKVRDRNFSEEKNFNLVMMAKATGARRSDLAAMSAKDFYHDSYGNLWVHIAQSKGGRDREAPVLPYYQGSVENFIKTRENEPLLFDKIHNAADIHSYRREYAQDLYDIVTHDPETADQYRAVYGPRNEPKAKGEYYYSHDKEAPFAGRRDDISIVSQALGHNRLDVSVNHYLK
ncbi:MAG: hypothetical protein J1E56_07360 [Ruminococcus sp.]|nr:hypothetical protein [Ruminococcus sp.]